MLPARAPEVAKSIFANTNQRKPNPKICIPKMENGWWIWVKVTRLFNQIKRPKRRQNHLRVWRTHLSRWLAEPDIGDRSNQKKSRRPGAPRVAWQTDSYIIDKAHLVQAGIYLSIPFYEIDGLRQKPQKGYNRSFHPCKVDQENHFTSSSN